MKKDKDAWKIESVNSLRRYKVKVRLLMFLEIIYHTLLPVLFTFWLLTTNNPMFFLPLVIIIFVRLNVK